MEPPAATGNTLARELQQWGSLGTKLAARYGVQFLTVVIKPKPGELSTAGGVGGVNMCASRHLRAAVGQLAIQQVLPVHLEASWQACRQIEFRRASFADLVADAGCIRLVQLAVSIVLLLAMPNRRTEFPWATGDDTSAAVDQASAHCIFFVPHCVISQS